MNDMLSNLKNIERKIEQVVKNVAGSRDWSVSASSTTLSHGSSGVNQLFADKLDSGYFIFNGNKAMKSISDNFSLVYKEINNDFEELRQDFRREWIGPDEIAFEAKLIDKIDSLKVRTRQLVVGSIHTISALLESWIDFQDYNSVDGSLTGASYLKKFIEVPVVNKPLAIDKMTKEFSAFDSLGLRNPMSADVLRTSLTTYLNKVGNRINEIYSDVRSSNGFFGEEQLDAMNGYFDAISELIKEVQTSMPELEETLTRLTTTSYKVQESSVSEQANSASRNVNNYELNDSAKLSRWSN